jgi:hypothetical protein
MSLKQAHVSRQTSTWWKAPNGDCPACPDHTFLVKVLNGNIGTQVFWWRCHRSLRILTWFTSLWRPFLQYKILKTLKTFSTLCDYSLRIIQRNTCTSFKILFCLPSCTGTAGTIATASSQTVLIQEISSRQSSDMIQLRLQLCLRQCFSAFRDSGNGKTESSMKRTVPTSRALKIIYKLNEYSKFRNLYSRSKNIHSFCCYKGGYVTVRNY